jgi:hypothetical protein
VPEAGASALPAPDEAPVAPAPQMEDLRLLEQFGQRIERLSAPSSLADVVPGGSFAQASYRMSLLALLRDSDADGMREAGEGPIADFLRMPVDVRFSEDIQPVDDDNVAAITVGEVTPRMANQP